MPPKEVVALIALFFLTFLPLGMNYNGIITVNDFFPGKDGSDLVVAHMVWIKDSGLENYFQFMSKLYVVFASASIIQFIAIVLPVTLYPDMPSVRAVLCFVWYASCVLFLRGCFALFLLPERCGLGMWLAVPCLMLFTHMIFAADEDVAAVNPARHPRVFLPNIAAFSPTKEVYPPPTDVEVVVKSETEESVCVAEEPKLEEKESGRGRSRARKTSKTALNGHSKSRGKSQNRSKSRGPVKTSGRARGKRKNGDLEN